MQVIYSGGNPRKQDSHPLLVEGYTRGHSLPAVHFAGCSYKSRTGSQGVREGPKAEMWRGWGLTWMSCKMNLSPHGSSTTAGADFQGGPRM
ncbi:hypothetical protein H8959_020983 [Pygathrix nigripes]